MGGGRGRVCAPVVEFVLRFLAIIGALLMSDSILEIIVPNFVRMVLSSTFFFGSGWRVG